jgi:CRP-like cAMP-binding protein
MVDIKGIMESMHDAIQKNNLFGDLLTTADREFLMQHGVIRTAAPGEILCRQNQQDNRVFIILNGRVEVTEMVSGEQVKLGELHAGELFGEISALFMMPRIATVTVLVPSVLLEIPGEVLEELIDKVPVIRDAVFQRYRERTLETALRAVPVFSGLGEDDLKALAENASLMGGRKDEVIIKEGEQGDALYIMNYGLARVYITIDGMSLNLALLRPGDYFGERAILTDAPRAASVASLTQFEAIRLDSRDFLDFIAARPSLRDAFDQVANERHSQTQQHRHMLESAEDIENVLKEIHDSMLNLRTLH